MFYEGKIKQEKGIKNQGGSSCCGDGDACVILKIGWGGRASPRDVWVENSSREVKWVYRNRIRGQSLSVISGAFNSLHSLLSFWNPLSELCTFILRLYGLKMQIPLEELLCKLLSIDYFCVNEFQNFYEVVRIENSARPWEVRGVQWLRAWIAWVSNPGFAWSSSVYLISLCLNFFNCKVEIIVSILVRLKWWCYVTFSELSWPLPMGGLPICPPWTGLAKANVWPLTCE